jgi:hypothetical protein
MILKLLEKTLMRNETNLKSKTKSRFDKKICYKKNRPLSLKKTRKDQYTWHLAIENKRFFIFCLLHLDKGVLYTNYHKHRLNQLNQLNGLLWLIKKSEGGC